jgi:ankyrin repeat protein
LAAYLIVCGSDVNKQNNFGRSALHYCATTCNLEIFKLLIKYNAKSETDALGSTPVFVAAYHGKKSLHKYK